MAQVHFPPANARDALRLVRAEIEMLEREMRAEGRAPDGDDYQHLFDEVSSCLIALGMRPPITHEDEELEAA